MWAETAPAVVKMTYVDQSNPDQSFGEIAAGETAEAGYNKLTGDAPNQTVEFVNTSWGVNFITYLQVDASSIPGTITGATLTFDGSGSAASNKNRTSIFGAGYNNSTWSSNLTYNTADKSITTVGTTYETASKKFATFETVTLNITDAFKNDADKIVTIIVYELQADHSYIKNPAVTITYTTETAYSVTFSETNGVKAAVKIDDNDVTSGTNLPNGTYNFTATATGYKNYAGSFTVADADKVVSFTMTPKSTYSYTVKAVDGESNDLGTVASGSGFEDDEVTYYYPEFILDGTTLYKKNNNGGNPYWGASGTLDSDNKEFTVTYGDGTIENVVFYKEAEEMDGFTAKTTNNAPIRCSNGTGGIVEESVKLVTLPKGKYTIFGQVWGTEGLTAGVSLNGKNVWTQASTGSLANSTSEEFNVPAESDLYVYTTGGNDNHMLDLIYIVKTGEGDAVVPVDIKTTGTTFSSAYAVDCANLPSGVKAYKVSTVAGGKATAEEVTEAVSAGTGLILVATAAGSYDIPVAASGTDISATNLLKAAVAAKTVADNEAYGLSEGKFYLLEAGTIPAGKAYLQASDITTAPELSIVFGGEATGIDTVKGEGFTVNGYYNLNGQRVAQPTKGLYIVNGHKVVIK